MVYLIPLCFFLFKLSLLYMTSRSLVIINLFLLSFFSLSPYLTSGFRPFLILSSSAFPLASSLYTTPHLSCPLSSPFFHFHHSVFYLSIFPHLIHLCCLIHLSSIYPSLHSSLCHYMPLSVLPSETHWITSQP